jgi:hypothetical protein
MIHRFRNYYRICRNKHGRYPGMGTATRWRSVKFACRMSWWSLTEGRFD